MDLSTLFIVALVIATLVGLTYVAFFKKVEDVPPPAEEVIPLELAPADPRRPRTSREEREQLRARRRERRERRAREQAAAAAAAPAAGMEGTGVADAAATAVEDTTGEILDAGTPPARPGVEQAEAAAAADAPVFESDANPSPEAIAAAPAPTTTPLTHEDDLTRIKGLGPKAASQLAALGVTRFDQIANWGPEEAADVDMRMGAFQGRMARDRWIEQASYLARGDLAGFEARFGSLG